MLIDQFSDDRHAVLLQLAQEHPRAIEMVKTASTDDTDLPSHSFAYPEQRRFPIHSPEQCLLSKLYAVKQASTVPEQVMQRIDYALELFRVDPTVIPQATKEASHTDTVDGETSQFLLPQYRKLSVKTASDVEPAAHALLSQRHKLKAATVTAAASELVKRAGAMGLQTDDLPSDIFKYAGLTTCDAGLLLDWIEARSIAAPTLDVGNQFRKLAQYLGAHFPRGGVIDDRDDLIKIAGIIEDLDTQAEFWPRYGRTLLDPVETVFNMDKIAEAVVALAGKSFPMSKLMALPADVYEEVLGEDVTQHAMANGQIDPDQLKALLETLPADLQSLFATHVSAYL
jgi:hypothetical protein